MVEAEQRPGDRRIVPAVAVAVGAAAAGFAGLAGLAARSDARAATERAGAIEIVELRADLRRTHTAETNTLLLEVFGAATAQDVDDARDARVASRTEVRARAGELATGTGTVAAEATFLIELLDSDGLDGQRVADPVDLLGSGHAAVHGGRAPVQEYDDEVVALYDLMRTDIAGALVVNDALDAAYVLDQPEIPELLSAYLSDSESYIRSDGGYLGPDAAAPLMASYVYDATASMPHPALAQVSAGIATSQLWNYDQWIRSWRQGTPEVAAPMTLSELAAHAGLVDGNTRGIVDAASTEARLRHQEDASSATTRSVAWGALAAWSALMTLASAHVLRRRSAAHRLADDELVDALTGVGSRRVLDRRVGPTLRDPALGWHLVAAIEVDQLVLINDTWGRAAGDRVLIEVGRRLGAIVDELEGSDDVLSGSVIRLGSEFLLTLHSVEPMEIDTVRQMLDEINTHSIPVGVDPTDDTIASDEHVALTCWAGIATSAGPCELDDIVRHAELAALMERQRLTGDQLAAAR